MRFGRANDVSIMIKYRWLLLIYIVYHFRELHEKHMKKERFRSDLQEFRMIQDKLNEKHRQEVEEENKRILRFLEERDRKEAEQKRLAEESKKSNGEFVDRMCAELTKTEVRVKMKENIFL